MFKLMLEIEDWKFKSFCSYDDQLVFYGSCFTENLSQKFKEFRFKTYCNSHGLAFNPKSIILGIEDCLNQKEYSSQDSSIFKVDNIYHSWHHHSSFSNTTMKNFLNHINQSILNGYSALRTAKFLFITLGSAWVYYLKNSNLTNQCLMPVTNCHKWAENNFEKKIMEIPEIILEFSLLIDKIVKINPQLQIIFTISPVRHLREGVIKNNYSKAHLISAVQSLLKKYNNISYLPSYEYLIDILRDYRYYTEDLVHPNHLATEFVWQNIKERFFSAETKSIMSELEFIIRGLNHKPFFPESNDHKNFLKKLEFKIKEFQNQYPFIKIFD